MINRILFAAALLAGASGAHAQNRPDTLRLPCAAAASLVRDAGAIVLGAGPNIYDRVVSSRAYCERDEQIEPRWLPARDTGSCFVGYTCERRTGDPASR